MRDAYSRLSFILAEQRLTLAALRARLREQGDPLDGKTLARLTDPDRPIKQVETRVADALCRALGINLAELIAFAPSLAVTLQALPAQQQEQLTALLELHTEGALPPQALPELEALVAVTDAIELHNLRQTIAHRERLRGAPTDQRHNAAD